MLRYVAECFSVFLYCSNYFSTWVAVLRWVARRCNTQFQVRKLEQSSVKVTTRTVVWKKQR